MRRWKAILALLVLAATAAGQEPAVSVPSTKLNPSDLCTVEGEVVKATTGEGLKEDLG